MNGNYNDLPNGYLESIRLGLDGVRRFRDGLSCGAGTREENMQRLKDALKQADAVIIGAGAGLSASAGFTYSGERFDRWFADFRDRFGITDMYSGGFYPFPDDETRWAWWARHIYINRYLPIPRPVYHTLLSLVRGKDYFVITTNVDHCFQRAGFEKTRLFYTQGDYGLFQSVNPDIRMTFDNESWGMQAMAAQGFVKGENGFYQGACGKEAMRLPASLVPVCPLDNSAVTMNLRSDENFVEDEGWHAASAAYADYLKKHRGKRVLFLELGVGGNTPVIIKYPFWQMTRENPRAVYACLNAHEACCPKQIEKQSICLDGDTGDVLARLV